MLILSKADGFALYENDISLIQSQVTIFTFSTVMPIPLGSNWVGGGRSAFVSGWGKRAQNDTSYSDTLQFLQVTTLTNPDAQNRMPDYRDEITDRVICTFTRVGDGVCRGDTGTALIAENFAIGVATFGPLSFQCGALPDCYSRISHFRPWILSVVG